MSFCKVERSLGLRISCLSALGIHSSAAKKAAGCPWRLTFCFLANTAKIAYLPQPSVKDADKPAMLLRGWLFVILLRRA